MNRIVKILLIALFAVIIAVLLYNAFGKKNNKKSNKKRKTAACFPFKGKHAAAAF